MRLTALGFTAWRAASALSSQFDAKTLFPKSKVLLKLRSDAPWVSVGHLCQTAKSLHLHSISPSAGFCLAKEGLTGL